MRVFISKRRSDLSLWRVTLLTLLILPAWAGTTLADQKQLRERLGGVRIPFVANRGQADPAVAYYAATFAGTVYVTRKGEIVYFLPGLASARGKAASAGWSLTETPVGGRTRITAEQRAETQVSYFIGNDCGRWLSGLDTYEGVGLGEVWPGVLLSLRAHGDNVEKLFTVRPGADPSRIRMRIAGAESLRVSEAGALVVATALGEVTFTRPVAYQDHEGIRSAVKVAYRAQGREYGFSVSGHDPALPVVIDPLLQATYLGGSSNDYLSALAFHPTSGELLVAGTTSSTNFPGTTGGAQPASGGAQDAFAARLNADLTTLIQATYLGGSGNEIGYGLAIHPTSGDVLVSGETPSINFPGTTGGAQPASGGDLDTFVARLNPTLTTLSQATYLGGSGFEQPYALAIHPTSGEVLVGGATGSNNFPGTTGGAQQVFGGLVDAFVARLNATLTTLSQATYLGGSNTDRGRAVAVHPTSGEVVFGGQTFSTNFPGTAGGAQPAIGGAGDGFVARLNATLTTLSQATYLGGSGNDNPASSQSLAIHPTSGEVLVTGFTLSANFPGTTGGAQPAFGGGFDAFVASLNATLTTLNQATYLGGNGDDQGRALRIHPTSGEVFVAGDTVSTNFPGTTDGAQPAFGGVQDAFVARLNATLTTLSQATYLGGSDTEFGNALAIHPTSGEVFVAGQTASTNFPGTAGGAQPAPGGFGGTDAFVARLTPDLASLATPQFMEVDARTVTGTSSNVNGVLESGETVQVGPFWKNIPNAPQALTGAASSLSGPGGPTYTIDDSSADYGTIAAESVGDCHTATGDCYLMTVSGARPAAHWDATFTEDLSAISTAKNWTLHVGESFPDVPTSNIFYRFIENLWHNAITGGCAGGNYCPGNSTTRAQMAVFLLKSAHGPSYVPPSCTGLFPDVACPSLFADWIEQLFTEGITGGCGGGNYCPNNAVRRDQMAAFLLKAKHGPSYVPPGCTGVFPDVACPSLFADWIEQLFAEAITGGCGGGNYCPLDPNTRGQMAVFLVKTFGLQLYGP